MILLIFVECIEFVTVALNPLTCDELPPDLPFDLEFWADVFAALGPCVIL